MLTSPTPPTYVHTIKNTYPAVVVRDSLVLNFTVVVMGTLVVCVELLEVWLFAIP